MNGRRKPKRLNYCIFAAIISAVFLSVAIFGKVAVPYGVLPICIAAVILNWSSMRQSAGHQRSVICTVISLVIVALGIIAHVAVALAVRRGNVDLAPYFVDNNVFLISVWLIILLVPLKRMLRPTAQIHPDLCAPRHVSDDVPS